MEETKKAPTKQRFKRRSFVDVSTAHVTIDDGRLLTKAAASNSGPFAVWHNEEYGWFVYVPADAKAIAQVFRAQWPYSDEFITLLQALADDSVDYICIDRDAPVLEGFPEVWDDA